MASPLAMVLKQLRAFKGLTQEQTGEAVRLSCSTITSFENGRRIPLPDAAKRLDELFGSGDLIQKLAAAERKGYQPTWFRPLPEYEQECLAIRWFENQVIPGLLQTEAFARAVLTSGVLAPEVAEEHLAIRMERQATVLRRPSPPVCEFVIDEQALHYGDADIRKAQLEHLLELMELPHVIIRVVPRSGRFYPGQNGPFILLALDQREEVGYVDDPLEGRVVTDLGRVADLERLWQAVSAVALPCDLSSVLIARLVSEL